MLSSLIGCAIAASITQSPRVVSLTPEFGEVGVSPELTELRVEFDRDMAAGRSLCGGGPQFPKITGPLRWESPRILVVPVSLQASQRYSMSLNCPGARNFASVDGTPADATPWAFETRNAAAEPEPPDLTPQENEQAIAKLRSYIEDRYSYRDRVVKSWDEALASELHALRAARRPGAFARILARPLAAAEDVHISIAVNGMVRGAYRAEPAVNYNPAATDRLPGVQRHNPVVTTAELEGGVGYILITGWPSDKPTGVYAPAFTALDRFVSAPGLIVDVRPNGGGDEQAARAFASRFVERAAVYSKNCYRDTSQPSGWGQVFDRTVPPQAPRFTQPVVVLIGKGCMSSNESFVLMMKHGAGAKLVGAPTFGASGNPREFDLGNGVKVRLPTWKDMLPDGTTLEGRGVEPDIGVLGEVTPTDDPVLRAGLDALGRSK